MKFHKKPASADVTYTGVMTTMLRWSEADNKRTLLKFDCDRAVRLVDTGAVRCTRCNTYYAKRPERCGQTIQARVRILRADGRVEDLLTSSNVSKSISLPEKCNSQEFDDRLDLRIYEHLALTNPETWIFKER